MTEERTNYAAALQPKPVTDTASALVLPHVLADLKARADWGLAKYQTYLHTHNGRDALVDTTADKLVRLRNQVNAILDNHRNLDAPKDSPVNWANLSCENVGITCDWRGDLCWTVTVAEAAPDATLFHDWLASKLAEAGYMPVEVVTEW